LVKVNRLVDQLEALEEAEVQEVLRVLKAIATVETKTVVSVVAVVVETKTEVSVEAVVAYATRGKRATAQEVTLAGFPIVMVGVEIAAAVEVEVVECVTHIKMVIVCGETPVGSPTNEVTKVEVVVAGVVSAMTTRKVDVIEEILVDSLMKMEVVEIGIEVTDKEDGEKDQDIDNREVGATIIEDTGMVVPHGQKMVFGTVMFFTKGTLAIVHHGRGPGIARLPAMVPTLDLVLGLILEAEEPPCRKVLADRVPVVRPKRLKCKQKLFLLLLRQRRRQQDYKLQWQGLQPSINYTRKLHNKKNVCAPEQLTNCLGGQIMVTKRIILPDRVAV